MKKKRIKFNIDKLRICYKQPQQLFDMLKSYNNGDYVQFEEFSLHITDNGRPQHPTDKEPTKIQANVILEDGTLLGEFRFNNSAKFEGKCFFAFDNYALYKVMAYSERGKSNYTHCMAWIEQELGLERNNITEIEIACDLNFNPEPQLQRLIKDIVNYDMLRNGKCVEDNSRIENYGEYFTRTRIKRQKYPTMYFSQAKDNSPSIKIYNKTREIEESDKWYINDWNEYGNSTTWRIEVMVKNEDFKEFQKRVGVDIAEWGEIESVVELLGIEQFKELLWIWITDRLVYFKNKRTDEVVSLWDIANKCA